VRYHKRLADKYQRLAAQARSKARRRQWLARSRKHRRRQHATAARWTAQIRWNNEHWREVFDAMRFVSLSRRTKPMMNTPYYDLLYPEQKYVEECQWIQRWLGLDNLERTILDLGCGSGRHAEHWARDYGHKVVGVDNCENMIKLARGREVEGVTFFQEDATQFRNDALRDNCDLVVSLFHVVNFLPNWRDIANLFKTAAYHCKVGGLFFFDTWGPSTVIPPVVKHVWNDQVEIHRMLTPSKYPADTRIKLKYDAFVKAQGEEKYDHIEEEILVNPVCQHLVHLLATDFCFEVQEVRCGFGGVDWLYKLRRVE